MSTSFDIIYQKAGINMKNKMIPNLLEDLSEFHIDIVIRNIIDLLDLQKQDMNTYPQSYPNCLSSSAKFIKKVSTPENNVISVNNVFQFSCGM